MLYFSARGTALTASRPSRDSDANDHGRRAPRDAVHAILRAAYLHRHPASPARPDPSPPTPANPDARSPRPAPPSPSRHRRAVPSEVRRRRATRTRDYAARRTASARAREASVGATGAAVSRGPIAGTPSSPQVATSRVRRGRNSASRAGRWASVAAHARGALGCPDVERSADDDGEGVRGRGVPPPGSRPSGSRRRRPRASGGVGEGPDGDRGGVGGGEDAGFARVPRAPHDAGPGVRRRRRDALQRTRGRGRAGGVFGNGATEGRRRRRALGGACHPRRRSRASRWRGCRWWRGGPGRSDTAAGPRFRGGASRWRGPGDHVPVAVVRQHVHMVVPAERLRADQEQRLLRAAHGGDAARRLRVEHRRAHPGQASRSRGRKKLPRTNSTLVTIAAFLVPRIDARAPRRSAPRPPGVRHRTVRGDGRAGGRPPRH